MSGIGRAADIDDVWWPGQQASGLDLTGRGAVLDEKA